ncbi:chitin deacetylase 7-like [Haemaphysalis longicornis]
METLALAGVSRRAERIHTTSAPTDVNTMTAETPELVSVSRREYNTAELFETTFTPKDQASSRSETPEGTTISRRDLAELFATTSAPEDESTTGVETPTRASVSRRSEPFDSTSAPTAGTGKREDKVCKLPGCVRSSRAPPAGLRVDDMPQFVILTFDDAVNALNMALYREILGNSTRKNKRNGCGITATFFVSGDYLDYRAVNELHSWGNEIALHPISRRTDLSYWRSINVTQWEREVLDQRAMLVAFANVPASDVTGFRGPFLFTGGDQGFSMLHKHFRYDSTLVHPRVRAELPVYPYTMDFGFRRSCNVLPCPQGSYPGLWEVPINVFFPTPSTGDVPCAVAEGCLPQPVTANDTFEYFKSNFDQFYTTNRAPFPVFLHEGYLRHPERKAGYLRFVDWLVEKDDVHLVTVSEVLRFMESPKRLSDYQKRPCTGRNDRCTSTCPRPMTCSYKNTPPGGERYMRTCSVCPKNYPWVKNPLGN